MTEPAASQPWIFTTGISVFTFILGFLVSRFTLSKKDRKDLEQVYFENATRLAEQHNAAYEKYCAAMKEYANADEPSFDHFVAIATTGDSYFYQARLLADAIMSGKIDAQVRDSTLLPKLRDIANKTLSLHYEVLQTIAKKKGFDYNGELRRADYQSIFDVIDKYGTGLP